MSQEIRNGNKKNRSNRPELIGLVRRFIRLYIEKQQNKEESRSDGSMPFLDTLVILQPDGSFSTTVYRKPTHTHLYLQWDSNHTIAAKYSVVNTLHHRAKAVCSNSQLLEKEEDHHTDGPTRK